MLILVTGVLSVKDFDKPGARFAAAFKYSFLIETLFGLRLKVSFSA